jgi:UDP-N-acetylmuramate--alanine ligase
MTCLAALKEKYGSKRLVCVFQPHTHDRTLKLYSDFLGAFADAGFLIVTDVYEARKDIERAKVDMPAFVEDIADRSKVRTVAGGSLSNVESLIASIAGDADVIVCLGAGDITNLAGKLTGK